MEREEGFRRRVDFLSRKGLLLFHQKNYKEAERCYKEMLSLARSINWDRNAVYAQNHLAFIAVAQGQLDEAETLLQTSLPVNKDKRLAAFHKHIVAFFYQKKGIIEEARRLAREARDDFERLGMKLETKAMDDLLQNLED